MKTKTRLYWLLGVMLLLVTALAIASVSTIWHMRGSGFAVIKANYNSILYMQAMVDALDTEPDSATRYAILDEQLKLQQQNVTEAPEHAATDRLEQAVSIFHRTPADPLAMQELRKSISGVSAVNRKAIVDKAKAQEYLGNQAVIWIGVASTFAFLIAFTLFLSMPEFFSEPIRRLTEGIDQIAEGHYDKRLVMQRRDEFGHVAMRFNSMAAELERWSKSSMARIMSEKSRAEAVINCLRHPSIGVDDQRRILFMNRQAAELLGVGEGELLGQEIGEAAKENELLAFILKANGTTNFKAVLGGHEQRFTVEVTAIEADHATLGTVFMLHNVTPYLERDEARTMFLATISHELKTPLASTDIGLGLLERQQATQLTADQAAIVDDLRKDHQRLVRIVSELLDMAQVETGRVRVNVKPQDLTSIVHEAVDALRPTADARKVRLEVHLNLPVPQVMADAEKATWSLINLVSNAVRYGPPNSDTTITCKAMGDEVHIAVADQGPGLTEEQQAHLFEQFVPHAGSGTGLGLSIARDLMRAMGGDISYHDGERSGSVFTMHFQAAPMA